MHGVSTQKTQPVDLEKMLNRSAYMVSVTMQMNFLLAGSTVTWPLPIRPD
jgi:hypothetical protein